MARGACISSSRSSSPWPSSFDDGALEVGSLVSLQGPFVVVVFVAAAVVVVVFVVVFVCFVFVVVVAVAAVDVVVIFVAVVVVSGDVVSFS